MMKVFTVWLIASLAYTAFVLKWSPIDFKTADKLKGIGHKEIKNLELARDNRLLKLKVSELTTKVNHLDSQNRSYANQLKSGTKVERTIASIPKVQANDLVMYEVYRWTPEKLLAIGEKELHFKNYTKSAQFYHELVSRFPAHQIVDDRTLFGAGIAAYESKANYPWAVSHFNKLVKTYPKSPFYRGAKLWLALSHYNMGEHQKFVATVEEFRKNYRNTEEWKILSKYYEDISYKFKK
jgi:TolA-binding protein